MADIRIVPGSSIMSFTSSLNFTEKITQDASGSLNLYGSGSTGRTELFSIDGNNGRLFTVSDDLSDSLFSVNTIAGLPVIEAFANNTVVMGQYGTNALVVSGSKVGIGTTSPSGKLTVYGDQVEWGNTSSLGFLGYTGGDALVGAIGSRNFALYTNASERMRITSGGNVGIGTTTPSEKLDVNGYVKATGFKTPSGTATQFLMADGSTNSNTYVKTDGTGATGTWGINISGNASKLNPLSGDSNYKLAYTADGARTNAGEWGRAVMYYVPNGQTYGIRVDRADYADNAGTVGGYAVSSLWRSDGGTWNPSTNITLNQTANSQEWSFDMYRNGYTGGYWHVWDSTNNIILKAAADTGRVSAPYSFDTPIFYDSNNTGYYVDPASTSNLYSLSVGSSMSLFGGYGGGSGPGLGFENQSTFCRLAFFGLDFYDWNDGIQMTINNNHVAATNSFRAPIFYDSNNTGYYIDPASTSVLNALTVGGSSVVTNNGGTWGINITGNAATATNSSQLGGIASDRFVFGDNANGRSKGMNSGNANTSDSTNSSGFYFGNNVTGMPSADWWNWLTVAGASWSGTDGYRWQMAGSFWSDDFRVRRQMSGGWQSWRTFILGDVWYGNTYIGANGAIYGTIFYDSNNSAYYVDPASTSNLLDVTTNSLGVGTAAPGTAGLIRATNDIVAYYSSDRRLKDNIAPISNPLEKISQIGGYEFDWNDNQDVYEGHDVGVIAQEIEEILPEIVTTRDNGYKAVKYEKIVPLLIEAIKEQQKQIDELKELIKNK